MAIADGQVLTAADFALYGSDTGWVAITPAGGFTATGNPAVRVVNGIAYLRGLLSGDMTANTTTIIATVPAGGRPPLNDGRAVGNVGTSGGAGGCWAEVTASGDIRCRVPTTATHNIGLGGLSGYPIG